MCALVLKVPGIGRRSFSLLERFRVAGKLKHKKVESKDLAALTRTYRQGKITLNEAVNLAKQIRGEEYRKRRMLVPNPPNIQNEDILRQYFSIEYRSRNIVDPNTIQNDFKRALRAIGKLSLFTATQQQLQNELAKINCSNQQRRIVSRLNSLLKFLNRDFKLRKAKKIRNLVKYLSIAEFDRVAANLDDPIAKTLAFAALYSGLRLGELFALQKHCLRPGSILVSVQMDRNLHFRETKNHLNGLRLLVDHQEKRKSLPSPIIEQKNLPKFANRRP